MTKPGEEMSPKDYRESLKGQVLMEMVVIRQAELLIGLALNHPRFDIYENVIGTVMPILENGETDCVCCKDHKFGPGPVNMPAAICLAVPVVEDEEGCGNAATGPVCHSCSSSMTKEEIIKRFRDTLAAIGVGSMELPKMGNA